MLKQLLADELAYRKARGELPVSVKELEARYAALGYKLDRSYDCRALSRYVTGERAGIAYPCCTTGLREIDTGARAFNVNARRDDRFRAMQDLRTSGLFAVSRGFILEP